MSANIEVNADQRIVEPDKYKNKVLVASFLAYAMDSLDMAVMAFALPLLVVSLDVSLVEASSIAVATNLGSAIGAVLWGPIGDKLGRRKALLLCISWFTVFAVACAFAPSILILSIFRFLSGLGLGGEWTVASAYLTEFWPPEKRAFATGTCQSSWAVGWFLALGVNYLFVPTFGWHVLFLSALIGLIPLFMIYALPESPYWLQNKDKLVEGKPEKVNYAEMIAPGVRKTFILASLLCSGAMIAYWGIATFLPTYLVTTRGLTLQTSTGILAATYIGSFFGYYFFSWLAERFGRRQEMIIGSIAGAILTFTFLNIEGGWIYAIIAIMGFVSPGYWAPLSALLAELAPSTKLRASFIGVTFGIGKWVVVVVPYAVSGFAATYGMQNALYVTSAFFFLVTISAYFLKETKGTVFKAD
jgi:MFS family permease